MVFGIHREDVSWLWTKEKLKAATGDGEKKETESKRKGITEEKEIKVKGEISINLERHMIIFVKLCHKIRGIKPGFELFMKIQEIV